MLEVWKVVDFGSRRLDPVSHEIRKFLFDAFLIFVNINLFDETSVE